MHGDWIEALQPLLRKVQAQAEGDAEFRQQLADLARSLLAWAEQTPAPLVPQSATPAPLAAVPVAPAPIVPPPVVPPAPIPLPPHLQEHDRAAVAMAPLLPSWQAAQVNDEDLLWLEKRCRLKAEGARWAAIRRRLLNEGADYTTDIEPKDRDIITRAKLLPDCFLWMCHPSGPNPPDLALFDDLAGCFEAAAASVALLLNILQTAEEDTELFERALCLAAEAQSSIRAGVLAMDGPEDRDQEKFFFWLRRTVFERHILIQRYMRRDDPANRAAWPDLLQRIQQVDEKVQRRKNREKIQRSQFNRMRYHFKRLREHPEEDHLHDWRRIVESIDELVDLGLPPSNPDLRDVLLPALEDLPEELEETKNFALVLREIDRFLASRPSRPDHAAAAVSEEVRAVAERLRGRSVVMIGGERRPSAHEALEKALELKELIWLETREHQSYVGFEPAVAHADVALVILAIRWSSHGFGEVKDYCDKYAKPLVRLPAGYHPNQVAHHILNQVGERLHARSRP